MEMLRRHPVALRSPDTPSVRALKEARQQRQQVLVDAACEGYLATVTAIHGSEEAGKTQREIYTIQVGDRKQLPLPSPTQFTDTQAPQMFLLGQQVGRLGFSPLDLHDITQKLAAHPERIQQLFGSLEHETKPTPEEFKQKFHQIFPQE